MPNQLLTDRTVIAVGGADATSFLHNLVTCEVEHLQPGEAAFGGLLSPQGKILFDFFLVRRPKGFWLDVAGELAGDLVQRLTFYRLRADVSLGPAGEEITVSAIWDQHEPQAGEARFVDPRLDAMGWRAYGAKADEATGDYHAHRIGLGMPHGGLDFAYGDAYPHETLMDQFGGVDFAKGCYVGQEVVSRVHHRGSARKRIVQVSGEAPLPEPGTPVTAGGKTVGAMGSASGKMGLAMLRLDRTREAMDEGVEILAGEQPVIPRIPDWAAFSWPGAAVA